MAMPICYSVCSDHIGECIIFAWVEAIREYLETYAAHLETGEKQNKILRISVHNYSDILLALHLLDRFINLYKRCSCIHVAISAF